MKLSIFILKENSHSFISRENRRSEHFLNIDDENFLPGNTNNLNSSPGHTFGKAKSLNRNCFFSLTNCVHLLVSSPHTNQHYQKYVEGMQTVVNELPSSYSKNGSESTVKKEP